MRHLAFKVDNATVVPGSACPGARTSLAERAPRRHGRAMNQQLAFRHEQSILLVAFASTLLVHRVLTQ
jgi:hypothetical protein